MEFRKSVSVMTYDDEFLKIIAVIFAETNKIR